MNTHTDTQAVAATHSAPTVIPLVPSLLKLADWIAALLLGVNVCVVCFTVAFRFFFHEHLVWSDEVARALMIALAFMGGATAMAHGNIVGIEYVRDRMTPRVLAVADAYVSIVVLIVSVMIVTNGTFLVMDTAEQTTAVGLPQNIFDLPMVLSGVFMTIFALDRMLRQPLKPLLFAAVPLALLAGLWFVLDGVDLAPSPLLMMAVGFLVSLIVGVPIGYVLGFAALVFMTFSPGLALEAFAQQGAGGVNNFVLLAVPFFMVTGFVMDVNGMSARLVTFLQYAVGGLRGGLNVVMVLAMVIFSGVSGSKLADVAAVGATLIPAAKRQGQSPADAVGLLAASAVMAETIPPCVNLIILGYVANVSIGGLFLSGIMPAAFMALALMVFVVIRAPSRKNRPAVETNPTGARPLRLWMSAGWTFGMIGLIFGGFRSGFATATEISAFAVLYAVVVGVVVFREFTWGSFVELFVSSAARAGMVLFIIGMSQNVAFVLTIEQIPHRLGDAMITLSGHVGTWAFLLVSIGILVVMGALLEGAAALLIFCPLLVPVGIRLGFDPLHYGLLLIISMGIGFFAPPLGLGLYTTCAIDRVPLEAAVKPTLKYLTVILVCVLVIAFVPQISLFLPRHFGY